MNDSELKEYIYECPEHFIGEMCKRSYSFFVKEFWNEIIADELVWNFHMDEICDQLQDLAYRILNGEETYDLLINVPPGTSKSTIVTAMFNAWFWTIMPQAKIMSGSYSPDLAMDQSSKTRDIVRSPKYMSYFPDIRIRQDTTAKSRFKNTKKGERYAHGVHGAVLGFHAHINLIDDPIPIKMEERSEDTILSAEHFFKTILPSRKVDKGRSPTVLVMQRVNIDDPSGYMIKSSKEKTKKLVHIKLPARLSDKTEVIPSYLKEKYVDGLLDPIRMSHSVLDDLEVDLGSLEFDGQYGQEPVSKGGNILKRQWFMIRKLIDLPPELFDQVVNMNADTATKDKTTNDPSGILSYIVYQNDLYLINWTNKRLQFPELIKAIINQHEMDCSSQSIIYVEPKSSGTDVVPQIRRQTRLNVVEYNMPNGDKTARLNPCTPYCEAGRVILVEGTWNKEFLDQLEYFPRYKHDEAVDNLTMAITQGLIRSNIKPSARTFRKIGN